MISFIKEEINVNKNKIMGVFPFASSEDCDGIIGCEFTAYTTGETHTATSGVYTAEEYCSRIAGYIAGTPFTQSITYGTLNDLSDCNRLTIAEQDAARVRRERRCALRHRGRIRLPVLQPNDHRRFKRSMENRFQRQLQTSSPYAR